MKCTKCTADVTNGVALCARCQQTLTEALVNVASYYADADRIQPGQRVKVRSAYVSTPPPSVDPVPDAVSEATDYVDTIVLGWVRNLEDDRPGIDKPPAHTTTACAWLEHHLPTIVTLEWAGECLREMLDCERMLRRILDRADTGWYAGKCGNELAPERSHDGFTCGCDCHHDGDCNLDCGDSPTIEAIVCPRGLYASTSSNWVRCPECGHTWQVDQRRDVMMQEASDELAPVRVLARVVIGLTDELSEERLTRRIEKWIERGQLHDYGVRVLDGRPRRVYRIGDVVKLVSGEVKPKAAEAC